MDWKIGILLAYCSVIIAVGLFGYKKARSFSDFFLGGGGVGAIMTAFSYGTAYFSAVVFVGFAGTVGWSFGYSGLWIAAGNAFIGVLLVWLVVGPRIRKVASEYGVATMPELFEKRYQSSFLKLFSSICIFVFFIPYSAAVFIGLSYLFTATFDIPYGHALAFMGTFTAAYVVLGGYRSMALIDVFFGMIMVIAVSTLLWSTVALGGGLASLTDSVAAADPGLVSVVGPPGLWPLFSLVFLTSVAPVAMPQLVQKFYAIRDARAIRIGSWGSTVFALLVCGVAYFLGASTRAFISQEKTPHVFDGDAPIFDALMPELLLHVTPEKLTILILLLILSASMSTLAALVLISSSSVAKDVYAGFINPKVSDQALTRLMRIASAGFILLSVVLAWARPGTIVAILAVSWGAIGSAFLGPFVWGLFWRRATRVGAISSSILALSVCLTMYVLGAGSPAAGTVGMIVSLASCPLISILFRRRSSSAEENSQRAA